MYKTRATSTLVSQVNWPRSGKRKHPNRQRPKDDSHCLPLAAPWVPINSKVGSSKPAHPHCRQFLRRQMPFLTVITESPGTAQSTGSTTRTSKNMSWGLTSSARASRSMSTSTGTPTTLFMAGCAHSARTRAHAAVRVGSVVLTGSRYTHSCPAGIYSDHQNRHRLNW